MKFKIGIPETDGEFKKNNPECIFIKNIKNLMIPGIILGLTLTLFLEFLIRLYILDKNFSFYSYKKLHLFLMILTLHEIVHLIYFPSIKNCIVGISFKKLIFYVTTKDYFTKTRLIIVLLAPLFFLTIAPLFLLFFIKSSLLAYIALFNLIGSGVDILSLIQVLKLPKNHIIMFNGPALYIKPEFQE